MAGSERISVIIPTYNRFAYVQNAIASVKRQTYPDVEIIVVNDASTQPEYCTHDFGAGVKIIHLPQNSRAVFGFPCGGYVRNQGVHASTGKYIAYLDDDDVWTNPQKLELQIAAMKETGCRFSSTDGLIGHGIYDPSKSYAVYNKQHYYTAIRNIYRRRGSAALESGYPRIWDKSFLSIHNCCITSSVVIERSLLDMINLMPHVPNGREDYGCWQNAIHHTNCVYVEEPCFYYDLGHGDGQNY
jgi:glycosyltransferase involved in cell wall biosynthesis